MWSPDTQTSKLITDLGKTLCFALFFCVFVKGRYIPEPILKYIIAKIAKLVPHDGDLRTKLVNSGSFSKLQQIQMSASSDVKELIDNINKEFPIELVHFYNPKHATFIVVPRKNHPQNLKCV